MVRAEFPEGGRPGDGPAEKKRRAVISHKQVKVAASAISQALSWGEDEGDAASKYSFLKIVVLEGMFAPGDVDDEGVFLQGASVRHIPS